MNEETGGYNEDLNKIHEALKSIGVEYLTADGQIRNTYDVLKDTSEIWDTLTKNQQSYIATVGAEGLECNQDSTLSCRTLI